jgi:hypothetical protein
MALVSSRTFRALERRVNDIAALLDVADSPNPGLAQLPPGTINLTAAKERIGPLVDGGFSVSVAPRALATDDDKLLVGRGTKETRKRSATMPAFLPKASGEDSTSGATTLANVETEDLPSNLTTANVPRLFCLSCTTEKTDPDHEYVFLTTTQAKTASEKRWETTLNGEEAMLHPLAWVVMRLVGTRKRVVDINRVGTVSTGIGIRDVESSMAGALDEFGIAGHWRKKATGAETIVLDDDHDWRRRSIDVSIAEDDPAADSATKTVARKWVRCAWSDVDLVTLGNYTVRVTAADDPDHPGALVLVASGASTNHYVVWARASTQESAICTCGEAGYQRADAEIVGYVDGMFAITANCVTCFDDFETPEYARFQGVLLDLVNPACRWARSSYIYAVRSGYYVYVHIIMDMIEENDKHFYRFSIQCANGGDGYIWVGESPHLDYKHDFDGIVITRTDGCNDTGVSAIVMKRGATY